METLCLFACGFVIGFVGFLIVTESCAWVVRRRLERRRRKVQEDKFMRYVALTDAEELKRDWAELAKVAKGLEFGMFSVRELKALKNKGVIKFNE